jgi:TrmH family RNA methyltransferase
VTRIASRQHPVVQRCRRLAAHRDDSRAVLLDGEHLVADALEAGISFDAILTDAPDRDVIARAARAGAPVYHATPEVMDAASPVRQTSGVVAIAVWAPAALNVLLRAPHALVVALVGVQDPGNVGAVIRAAEALGASGVAAIDDSADPGGWKALRGAMGSTFRVPVARAALDELITGARAHRLHVVATVPEGGTPLAAAVFEEPSVLLLGSEGRGLPDRALAAADRTITIPMRPRVNSLNVAVTTALLLWEANRGRR